MEEAFAMPDRQYGFLTARRCLERGRLPASIEQAWG
jgi:hypothetical protein